MFFIRLKIKRLKKKLKSMQAYRVHNQPNDEQILQEIGYYKTLATIYEKLIGHKAFPFAKEMVLECLRSATVLEDKSAQYQLGKKLLETAKFHDNLEQEGIFSSTANQQRMSRLYEESKAYLQAAEQLGHVQAKRLLGLCYINGWGVEKESDKGFSLIIESIDKEGSWDRVPQIFAEIGLNKPEFFAMLVKHRKKS